MMRTLHRALLACLTLALSPLALAQAYVVDRFHADLKLDANGRMSVDEAIDVTFHEARRGIYRTIPYVYDTGKGLSRKIFLGGIRVTDDLGTELTTKVTREDGNVTIRVGDEDVFLNPGTQVKYRFHYEVRNVINWFDNPYDWVPYAELYWNVTGDQWDATIVEPSFTVTFPQAPSDKGLRARLFAGPYGSRNSQVLDRVASQAYGPATDTRMTLGRSELSGAKLSQLEPYNGLTVVLNVPSDLIRKPTLTERLTDLLMANLGLSLPLFVGLLLMLSWMRFGRDHMPGPLVVQYDPPDGLSGSACGALLDERIDPRDVAAGIVSLAVKGHVAITPVEEGFVFKKQSAHLTVIEREDRKGLTKFESKLLSLLKDCSSPITSTELRSEVAPSIMTLKERLYDELVDKGYYQRSPDKVRNAWGCGGFLVIGALAFGTVVVSPIPNPLAAGIGGVLSLILLGIFVPLMPRRTTEGAMARHRVKGFEEFMSRARSDDMQWMSEKHPDAAMFEQFLPHAVAFGLVDRWTTAFKDIVTQPPSWYLATPGRPFTMHGLGTELSSVADTVGTAASTPPRSSGASGGSSGFSSGGGFSGGGFGGGGGGSW